MKELLLYVFFQAFFTTQFLASDQATNNFDYCSSAKKYLKSENLDLADDVPNAPLQNYHSDYCAYRTSSCCSRFVEKIVAAKQIIQLESAINEVVFEMKKEFDKNIQNFHDAVILSIRASGHNLNNVFNKTYGIVYGKNVDLFYDLFTRLEDFTSFNDLKSRISKIQSNPNDFLASSQQNKSKKLYYRTKRREPTSDLKEIIGDFFVNIYLRMFTLLNPQYYFDAKRLDCVKSNYNKVRPFSGLSGGLNGEEPARELIVHVSRSLVAAKSLIYALQQVSTSVLDVDSVKYSGAQRKINAHWISKVIHLDDSSKMGLMSLWGCPVCDPITSLTTYNGEGKACPQFCKTVIHHALRHVKTISDDWNSFIDAALKVVNRLLGPFSVESNIATLDVKISEAVMNFQENSLSFSNEIFKSCGQPPLKSYESEAEKIMTFQDGPHPELLGFRASFNGTAYGIPQINEVLKGWENLLKNAKYFWVDIEQSLTFKLCPNFLHAPPGKNNNVTTGNFTVIQRTISHCWNGTSRKNDGNNFTEHSTNGSLGNITVSGDAETWPFLKMKSKTLEIEEILNENKLFLTQLALKLNQAFQGSAVYIPDEEVLSQSLAPRSTSKLPIDDETMHSPMEDLEGSGSGEQPAVIKQLYTPRAQDPPRPMETQPRVNLDESNRAYITETSPSYNYVTTINTHPLIYDLEMEDNRFGSGDEDSTRGVMLVSSLKPLEDYADVDEKMTTDPTLDVDNSLSGIGKFRKRKQGESTSSNSGQEGKSQTSENFLYRIGITFFMLGVVLVP